MTKKPVGRPSLKSLGIAPRVRRNLNIERNEMFDADLLAMRQIVAKDQQVPLESIDQSTAVRMAVKFFVKERGSK